MWKDVWYIVTDKELSQRAKELFCPNTEKLTAWSSGWQIQWIPFDPGWPVKSYELKPDKVQTSGPKDTLGETITKIISLEEDINTRIDELVEQKADAMRRIQNVPDQDQQNILIARYVTGKMGKDCCWP